MDHLKIQLPAEIKDMLFLDWPGKMLIHTLLEKIPMKEMP